jgi:hypothetical protein
MTEEILASQEGLCSIDFVCYLVKLMNVCVRAQCIALPRISDTIELHVLCRPNKRTVGRRSYFPENVTASAGTPLACCSTDTVGCLSKG